MNKIMIVDDNREVCQLLSEIIIRENCTPLVYNSASDVFSELQGNENISMAIIDIRMPGDSGVKLAWDLRKINSEIPIIILSGFIQNWYPPDIRDCGADCILDKPVDIRMLQHIIERFTSKGRKEGGCAGCSYAEKNCPYCDLELQSDARR